MRVAVISDVHGNRRAFEAVLKDLEEVSPDLVLHGGDLAANGAHPAEIIDQIRSLGWLGVRGNTDEMLWAPETLPQLTARYPKLAPILRALEEMIPPPRRPSETNGCTGLKRSHIVILYLQRASR